MSGDLRIQRPTLLADFVPPVTYSLGQSGSKERRYASHSKAQDQEIIYQIFRDVFSVNSPLPRLIQQMIRDYVPLETAFILRPAIATIFPDFVNLNDRQTLEKYVGTQCKTAKHMDWALKIATRIYESAPRSITSLQHGRSFPMDAEILAYAMRLATDQKVLEIAGASGENAILLAFAGAKKVYFNDIASGEVAIFNALRQQLPKDIQEKLEAIDGSCFELLKKKPELLHQIDLILCRNLIHFFDDDEQDVFFKLLKLLLKPGGYVILTTNPTYNDPAFQKTFEENPVSTTFNLTHCVLTDLSKSTAPSAVIYGEACANTNTLPFGCSTVKLYQKGLQTGFKWQVDNQQFKKLDAVMRAKIKAACTRCKKQILSIKEGNVKILFNKIRIYNEDTLSLLLKSKGFDVVSPFFVGLDGHLVRGADLVGVVQHVGIICKKTK